VANFNLIYIATSHLHCAGNMCSDNEFKISLNLVETNNIVASNIIVCVYLHT